MKKWNRFWALVGLIGAAALAAAAQMSGRLGGTVYDTEGKPWPDVTVTIKKNDSNQIYTAKTDKKGHYLQIGLTGGIYTVTFEKDQFTGQSAPQRQVRLAADEEQTLDLNFKDIISKSAGYSEALKKQEEEKKKFEGMKSHFDAGRAALNQADQLNSQLAQTPPDQRAATQQKIAELSQTAVTEFQQAQQAAGEKDPNLHLVLANLAKAYETAGKFDDAAATFQKAIELKPLPNYYLAMGTNLARAGKMQEANAACEKMAALDPTNTATCWRNLGIVLVNSGKMKEAVEPLQKATQADPKNPDAWYWLGSSLLNAMDFKQEGDKIVPVVKPGTVEAFQKYLELAPTGPRAADAKAALEQLQALGQGVETTVKKKKKG